MAKKRRRSPTKSSKSARIGSRLFKSISGIRHTVFPGIPNIRLLLTLKDEEISQAMCADLQRVLKVDELTDVELRIAAKFRHYKWERRVKDRRSFKRALAKYQESHPDVDIIAENISR